MADDCCKLVGNLKLPEALGCITSVNVSSKLEIIKKCGTEILTGPTTGTVSITGYATESIHVGCPGRAGVSIPWIRKYDCEAGNDTVYMIPGGQGSSFVAGDVESLAALKIGSGRSFISISANSTSGPATVYMETSQEDGYGLDYDGGPIPFDTETNLIILSAGQLPAPLYLQNFSVEFNPGSIPTATYSFLFIDDSDIDTT